MKQTKNNKGLISNKRYVLINLLIRKEKNFMLIIAISFLLSGIFYPFPSIAMWIGFALAAYSAVANDSIQTIGTFISSNGDKKWWLLWLFIGSIFLITITISWVIYDGDVTYQRLASKGFSEAPTSFHFLQIAAPIFLLIITRLRMPVSTTFLLLSSFTTASGSIVKMLEKSMVGYVIAFALAFLIWITLNKLMKEAFKGKANFSWTVAQWIISGFLWALWIMQDAANIAVFLPRSLSIGQFIVFGSTIFFGLGLIFFLKGDKIQRVVNEKSDVKDVRPATIIDLVYAIILIWFTWINIIPMSTTWVFIGLLGGRELAIKIQNKDKLKKTYSLILKDLAYVLIGLLISIVVAISANNMLREEIMLMFN
jgi:hypothetical protein